MPIEAYYIVSNNGTINKLECMWMEPAVAQFVVLSRNLNEGVEENHGKLQSGWLISKPIFHFWTS
jgi:hypothetical protein